MSDIIFARAVSMTQLYIAKILDIGIARPCKKQLVRVTCINILNPLPLWAA